ncbi:NADH-quinone oxidoreductase subunit C [Prosthecochloris sp. HL-130-GSB]|jgi:NADH-quinone oxidoreductase subunit C|uniref:NADH-quinone oxidoreductase subunit C n=1 Tax=Prosthecochloris sp. HL-130-GSB TaxID=1974213 RepID=UPI000A1C0EE7|nr:NADH-quinone oxidoreductase subunit C [Prosthecochloris sp. HL-130-GSB]ARM31090.1 NADH-quinone oxidoreductase subunit C [Prosthecochloris sp. HL-130-GSB]
MEEAQGQAKVSPEVSSAAAAYAVVHEKFGEAVSAFDDNPLMPFFEVLDVILWQEIALFLRDHPRLRFTYMACLSGMDYPEDDKLGIVCNLESLGALDHRIAVKVRCSRDGGRIPSVADVWKTADWHEREAYDMYGIMFDGHPDLRRILCPEDWEGFPLRKDYQEQETYHGIKVPY